MSKEAPAQHGWFVDPQDPRMLRMWDGTQWTSLTKFPAVGEVPAGPAPSAPVRTPSAEPRPLHFGDAAPAPMRDAFGEATYRPLPASSVDTLERPSPVLPAPTSAPAPATADTRPRSSELEPDERDAMTLLRGNLWAVIAIGLSVVFFIAASITTWAIAAAIVPVLLACRSYQTQEQMAPLAALAAAASVVIALVLYAQ